MNAHDLSVRIEKLEHENRRMKWIGAGAATLGGIAVLCSFALAPVCRTVWGERFVLQDSKGNDRAVMTAYETGGAPQFSLLDRSGKKALTLGVAEDGRAYLEVASTDGPVRSHFAVSPEGHATIEKPAPKEQKKGDTVGMHAR